MYVLEDFSGISKDKFSREKKVHSTRGFVLQFSISSSASNQPFLDHLTIGFHHQEGPGRDSGHFIL